MIRFLDGALFRRYNISGFFRREVSMVRRAFGVVLTVLLMLLLASACAETAQDITSRCHFNASSGRKTFSRCKDRDYETYWRTDNGAKACVQVTVPSGQTASGVMVQWYERPHGWGLQVQDENGNWTYTGHTDGLYLAEYLPLPEGTTVFRVVNAPDVKTHFNMMELRVYGAGDLSPEVQLWEPSAEKADLMLLVAHADDEVLWFGGTLPTYAGEEGRICQVCTLVPSMPYRRLELLDCLWACGVRQYPVWGGFTDAFSGSLAKQYKKWSKNRVYETVTGWIRRFQPDVLLTHDINGEYGHGAHRVCADAVMNCLKAAADSKKYAASAKEYGVWDVPKTYIHLYSKNVIDMDWRRPLSAFGGKTSFDVAAEGFRRHVSQQKTDYHVEDWGPWDNSLFGLYRSLVGDDVLKNDFFENID